MADKIKFNKLIDLFDNPQRPESKPLVYQILGYKRVADANSFRVILSDTEEYINVSCQEDFYNTLQDKNRFQLCHLKEHNTFQLGDRAGGKLVVRLVAADLVDAGLGAPVGEPKPMKNMFGEPTARMGPIPTTASEDLSKSSDSNRGAFEKASSAGSFYAKPEASSNEKIQHPQEVKPAPPKTTDSALRAGSQKSVTTLPIEAISHYSNGFVLKVTCTRKFDIRTWKNSNNEGKVFSANFMDSTGQIKATGFNAEVDRFYDILEEGKTFLISGCRVIPANKQYSRLNDCELKFERETKIEKCDEADEKPSYKFNFLNIVDINNAEVNSNIDVIGILKEVFDLTSVVSKATGKNFDRRDIILADKSGYTVKGTIWGKTAQDFAQEVGTIVAIKGAKVSEYKGKNISVSSSSLFLVNPEIPEAYALRDWFNTGFKEIEFKDLSSLDGAGAIGTASKFETPRTTIDQVMSNPEVGKADRGEYFTVIATVLNFKSEIFAYPSCQGENCNKKVIQDSDSRWRCEKCNKSFDEPTYRYILNLDIADHSGHTWVTAFDDPARVLLGGKTADELIKLNDINPVDFKAIFRDNQFKDFVFRCRVKQEIYQDESKIRTQIMDAQPIDYKSEVKRLIEDISLFQ